MGPIINYGNIDDDGDGYILCMVLECDIYTWWRMYIIVCTCEIKGARGVRVGSTRNQISSHSQEKVVYHGLIGQKVLGLLVKKVWLLIFNFFSSGCPCMLCIVVYHMGLDLDM